MLPEPDCPQSRVKLCRVFDAWIAYPREKYGLLNILFKECLGYRMQYVVNWGLRANRCHRFESRYRHEGIYEAKRKKKVPYPSCPWEEYVCVVVKPDIRT